MLKSLYLKFKEINKNIKLIAEGVDLGTMKINDTYALAIIQNILHEGPYLALNGGAIRPLGLAYILNEILINKRENVLEVGSGISTILMARLIKKNCLNTKIHSIEHNKKWCNQLQEILEYEKLEDYVNIIHCGLNIIEDKYAKKWYDIKKDKFKNLKFDFVIIDGPPANQASLRMSRYPIINFIEDKLQNDDFCIFLDDVNRKGEKILAQDLVSKFPESQFNYVDNTIFILNSKQNFNPIPMHYTKNS